MRLNRVLAQSGLGSRRAVEGLIRAGRVAVNGRPAELGQDVGEEDAVTVDGRPVQRKKEHVYFLFHKPAGVLCSRGDTHGRATLYDLLPPELQDLHYVGRLDKDSRGLLFLTDDGDFTQALTHPRHGVLRLYDARVGKAVTRQEIDALRRGVEVEPGVVFQCAVAEAGPDGSWRLGLREGKKREIRRLLAALGHRVVDLKRIAFGGVELGSLPEGSFRPLSRRELEILRGAAGASMADAARPARGGGRAPARRAQSA